MEKGALLLQNSLKNLRNIFILIIKLLWLVSIFILWSSDNLSAYIHAQLRTDGTESSSNENYF